MGYLLVPAFGAKEGVADIAIASRDAFDFTRIAVAIKLISLFVDDSVGWIMSGLKSLRKGGGAETVPKPRGRISIAFSLLLEPSCQLCIGL